MPVIVQKVENELFRKSGIAVCVLLAPDSVVYFQLTVFTVVHYMQEIDISKFKYKL